MDHYQRVLANAMDNPELLEIIYNTKFTGGQLAQLPYAVFHNAIVHEEQKIFWGVLQNGVNYTNFLDNFHRIVCHPISTFRFRVRLVPPPFTVKEMQKECDEMLCDLAFVKMLRSANGYLDY